MIPMTTVHNHNEQLNHNELWELPTARWEEALEVAAGWDDEGPFTDWPACMAIVAQYGTLVTSEPVKQLTARILPFETKAAREKRLQDDLASLSIYAQIPDGDQLGPFGAD